MPRGLSPVSSRQICRQHPREVAAQGSLCDGSFPGSWDVSPRAAGARGTLGCPSVQGHIAARAQQVKVHHPSTGCDTVVPTVGKDGTNMSHLYQVSAPSLEHAPCIPILCCSIPSCPLESWNCLGP